jgi:hypothetical protein
MPVMTGLTPFDTKSMQTRAHAIWLTARVPEHGLREPRPRTAVHLRTEAKDDDTF